MSFIDQIISHRSIRHYRPDPVPEDLLQQILTAGVHASTSGNLQAYSIVVTADRQLKEQLYEPHLRQNMVREAPLLMTFCADFNRLRHWLQLNDAPTVSTI